MSKEPDISPETLVVAVKEQMSTSLGEEAVILQLKKGVYYGLNPLGARIWELLKEPRTVRDIKEVILAEYEVGPEQCEQDLLRLLKELAAHGLIEVRRGTAPQNP